MVAVKFSSLPAYGVAIDRLGQAIERADAILRTETGMWVSPAGVQALRTALEGAEEPLNALIRDVMIEGSRDRDEIHVRAEREMSWNGFAMAALIAARSEEHTSELQSLMRISYAVFCLKKKKPTTLTTNLTDLQT